jgi:hypothetical protein
LKDNAATTSVWDNHVHRALANAATMRLGKPSFARSIFLKLICGSARVHVSLMQIAAVEPYAMATRMILSLEKDAFPPIARIGKPPTLMAGRAKLVNPMPAASPIDDCASPLLFFSNASSPAAPGLRLFYQCLWCDN